MKLSIIVPVYNVTEYLKRCIDSLLDQKGFSDYEIILVDDGSTDDSGKLCEEYALYCDKFLIVHKPNGGQASARNRGMKLAIGEYIQFVDSDDCIVPNCLEKVVNCAFKSNVDVEYYNFEYIFDANQKKENDLHRKLDGVVSGSEFLKTKLNNNTMLMSPCIFIFSKSIVRAHDIWFIEGRYHEDEEWVPRLLYYAVRVSALDDVVYEYYIRNNSTTTNSANNRRASNDLLLNCEALVEFCKTIDDQELRGMIENNIVTLALSAYYKGRLIEQRKQVTNIVTSLSMNWKNANKVKLLSVFPKGYIAINYCLKKLISVIRLLSNIKLSEK